MKKWCFWLIILLFSCQTKSQEKEVLSENQHQQNGLPQNRINELKKYLKGTKYNQDVAMFINFGISSNKYRFFIYDLKRNKILEHGLVAHGSGSQMAHSNKLTFSNLENSYQSSLGKYEISDSYIGKFGKSYRLKGLDRTNSNAMKRAIVLHSLDCVSNFESEIPCCLSLGCPMLSPQFFKTTSSYIDHSEKSMILYAFY